MIKKPHISSTRILNKSKNPKFNKDDLKLNLIQHNKKILLDDQIDPITNRSQTMQKKCDLLLSAPYFKILNDSPIETPPTTIRAKTIEENNNKLSNHKIYFLEKIEEEKNDLNQKSINSHPYNQIVREIKDFDENIKKNTLCIEVENGFDDKSLNLFVFSESERVNLNPKNMDFSLRNEDFQNEKFEFNSIEFSKPFELGEQIKTEIPNALNTSKGI